MTEQVPNLSEYELIDVLAIDSHGIDETFDIEVEGVHCFSAKEPVSGLESVTHNSASICLFSKDDNEMMTAKTGDWFVKNKQRARSNNSVILVRNECTQADFDRIMESTREFGEPGFMFVDHPDTGGNPCLEISLFPQTQDGLSGFQMCNLTEINGRYCETQEKFLECCRASAIIGTMQAGYTDFKYFSPETKEITDREALLGCSITGIMDNPAVLLDPKTLRKGADQVKETNRRVAALIGINPAARCCAVKPSGTSSLVLSSASGVHPHHARRYMRRVQTNALEFATQVYQETNPEAMENSVWESTGRDKIITFLCEVPKGAIVKNDLSALDMLEKVKLVQQNWVDRGTNEDLCVRPWLRHNVSNTVVVKPDEWEAVSKYIYDNRWRFTGISLLSGSGDLDYPQAPLVTILNAREITEAYGDGAVLASGLIVDGKRAFNGNLWSACDCVLHGIEAGSPDMFDWVRRGHQFADRYFEGDRRRMTYCLKHVDLWKKWMDIARTHKPIDWSQVTEEQQELVSADTLAAQACSGGACEIVR